MEGVNLRDPLRAGASKAELSEIITGAWAARTDRGAVDRLAQRDRTPFIPLTALKSDPHLEMHTRGG
jgi:cyclic pyranopterin phosphate synthase